MKLTVYVVSLSGERPVVLWLCGLPGKEERGRERERETERKDANPGEKSATATDASSDLEKHGREGDGAQEAAGTDDDSSRHAKG